MHRNLWSWIKIYSNIVYWDDGNQSDGDGWSSSCNIESGWNCLGGSNTAKDSCTEIWGDGVKYNTISSYWDDHNNIDGDGWDSSWNVESGWSWNGGSSTNQDNCSEVWGDGKRFNTISTYWDDGNILDNDGWDSSWSIELGYSCSGGSTSTKDVWIEIWGDSKRFNSNVTYCDDGNTLNGDGCTSLCIIESGWNWSGGTSSTKDICSEIWGDGRRFNSISTYWDDGNSVDGDGWDSNWAKEVDWSLSGGNSSTKDIWTENWGDGKRYNTNSTYWDDGNNVSGDGWSSM